MSSLVHDELLERTKDFSNLNQVVKKNGVLTLQKKRDRELFDYLAKTIVSQQLSNSAAHTIWSRLLEAKGPDKELLIDFCSNENAEILKTCGLSRMKIRAILEMRTAFKDGNFEADLIESKDLAEIVSTISSLWGLGRWSAEMTAIFFFALQDVWSDGDAALRRGLLIISELDSVEPQEILLKIKPYRSFLALHVWRALDTGLLAIDHMERP